MSSPEQQAGKFYLKWPWNLVVYAALVLLLRVFSIPVILLLMAWNKKRQPNDGPEEGYCLQRTRRRLARLGWSLLYLVIGFCCGVVFFTQLREERSAWVVEDWAMLVVSGVVALGASLLCVYETYTDLRDALSPGKSRLAKSIRSQLPYPDEAPDVKELFAMVDRDIRENGQWFDRVAVGRDWVLGDDVTAISRIRVVAGRDEVVHRHAGGRTQTARIVALHILDDRRQIQITGLRDPRELDALLTCLRLRAPEALTVPYSAFSGYAGKSEEEWQELERTYQSRLSARKLDEEPRERDAVRSDPCFVFSDLRGQHTSRFDRSTVAEQLAGLTGETRPVGLELLEPAPVPGLNGVSLAGLAACVLDGRLTLVAKLRMADGRHQFFARAAGEQEVQSAFAVLMERRQIPDLSDLSMWQPYMMANRGRQPQQKKLIYSDSRGSTREFTHFSRRDVELAGEGLANGKYTVAALYAGARYLYLQAGNQMDGRVTANASRPDQDALRVFETKCTDRQAQAWLLAMYEGNFDPDFSQWKDITKKLQKQANRK